MSGSIETVHACRDGCGGAQAYTQLEYCTYRMTLNFATSMVCMSSHGKVKIYHRPTCSSKYHAAGLGIAYSILSCPLPIRYTPI